MTARKRPTVAVVGGGVAGLTAAWRLQNAGVAVEVLEKSDAVGGRTLSVRRDGFVFDVGAITMLPTYANTCALIEQLGLSARLHRVAPVIGIPRNGRMHSIDLANPLRSLLRTRLISTTDKLRLLKLLFPLARAWKDASYRTLATLADWDRESVSDYVRREFGEEIHEYIAGPVIRGNTLNSTECAPAGELLWMLRQYAAPFVQNFDGGINLLAESLSERLPVIRDVEVQGVRAAECGVTVHGVHQGAAFSRYFDACVLALPPPALLALAPDLRPGQRAFLEGIKALPSLNVHVGLRRRPPVEQTFILPPESEHPVLTTVVMDHLKAPGRAPEGKGVMSLFCRDTWCAENMHRSDAEILDEVLRMAIPFVGDLRADVESAVVQRWPYSTIKSETGLYRRMREYEADVDADSRVQIGADFLSLGMEAAVTGGLDAAQRILRLLLPASGFQAGDGRY